MRHWSMMAGKGRGLRALSFLICCSVLTVSLLLAWRGGGERLGSIDADGTPTQPLVSPVEVQGGAGAASVQRSVVPAEPTVQQVPDVASIVGVTNGTEHPAGFRVTRLVGELVGYAVLTPVTRTVRVRAKHRGSGRPVDVSLNLANCAEVPEDFQASCLVAMGGMALGVGGELRGGGAAFIEVGLSDIGFSSASCRLFYYDERAPVPSDLAVIRGRPEVFVWSRKEGALYSVLPAKGTRHIYLEGLGRDAKEALRYLSVYEDTTLSGEPVRRFRLSRHRNPSVSERVWGGAGVLWVEDVGINGFVDRMF